MYIIHIKEYCIRKWSLYEFGSPDYNTLSFPRKFPGFHSTNNSSNCETLRMGKVSLKGRHVKEYFRCFNPNLLK